MCEDCLLHFPSSMKRALLLSRSCAHSTIHYGKACAGNCLTCFCLLSMTTSDVCVLTMCSLQIWLLNLSNLSRHLVVAACCFLLCATTLSFTPYTHHPSGEVKYPFIHGKCRSSNHSVIRRELLARCLNHHN